MSKRCAECIFFSYKINKEGKMDWWSKGECSLINKKVYDAGLCDFWKRKPTNK